MSDVLKKVIDVNDYKNGTAIVSIGPIGRTVNQKLDTVFNQTSQIPTQTGVLDTRLDDVRYYTGDSAS